MSKNVDGDEAMMHEVGDEMTGRSENVEDTHRSSMVDKRHLE